MGSDRDEDGGAEDKPLLPGGAPRQPRSSLTAQIGRAFSLNKGAARAVLAAAVSVAWMFFSSVLILLNKYILKDLKFP